MNGEIFLALFIIAILISISIGLFRAYIFIFKNKSDLYIKGNTYLILDIDEIGDKLEYYVRKIEDDISNRYIYISKIILYSKAFNIDTTDIKNPCEIFKISKILSDNYSNIILLNNINDIIDKKL